MLVTLGMVENVTGVVIGRTFQPGWREISHIFIVILKMLALIAPQCSYWQLIPLCCTTATGDSHTQHQTHTATSQPTCHLAFFPAMTNMLSLGDRFISNKNAWPCSMITWKLAPMSDCNNYLCLYIIITTPKCYQCID